MILSGKEIRCRLGIRNPVGDIKAMKPDYIIPTYCTGFEAKVAFCLEMPDQFIHNMAGTLYTFAA